jgi:hypothetical protein
VRFTVSAMHSQFKAADQLIALVYDDLRRWNFGVVDAALHWRQSLLFTPGFSPVKEQGSIENRFNGFS